MTSPVKIHIYSVYAKPGTALATLKKELSAVLEDLSGDIVIMGDFNCVGSKREQLDKHMERHGLQQMIHVPTTNSNTTLDLVFTNLCGIELGTLETYYSYHKAVFLKLSLD